MSRFISERIARWLKQTAGNNNLMLVDDPRVYKLVTLIFSVGIFVAGTINLSSKVNETSADLKQLGSRIDAKFDAFDAKFTASDAKMDAKFTASDAKMDKQFSTIMAFIAIGRLPGEFLEKIEATPSPDTLSTP